MSPEQHRVLAPGPLAVPPGRLRIQRQMGILAYLPQYVARVGGLALVVAVVVSALPALITGRASQGRDWSASRVRAVAALGALIVGGWGLLIAFVIRAEPPGGFAGGHWGTTSSKVVLGVWLFGLAAFTAWNLRRGLRGPRDGSRAVEAAPRGYEVISPPSAAKRTGPSFVGGLHYGGKFSGSNASAPLARMDIEADQVTLSLNGRVGRYMGGKANMPIPATFRPGDTRLVEPYRGLFSEGLRFCTADHRDGLVFWTGGNRAKIVELLRASGFQVASDS